MSIKSVFKMSMSDRLVLLIYFSTLPLNVWECFCNYPNEYYKRSKKSWRIYNWSQNIFLEPKNRLFGSCSASEGGKNQTSSFLNNIQTPLRRDAGQTFLQVVFFLFSAEISRFFGCSSTSWFIFDSPPTWKNKDYFYYSVFMTYSREII